MGNCLNGNMIVEADQEQEQTHVEAPVEQKLSHVNDGKKKKKVSFNLVEDGGIKHGDHSRGGVVRIRVVVTQEELKQLLKYSQDHNSAETSSVEQLLRTVKKRSKKVSGDGEVRGSTWRPALDSIPEDH